MEKEMVEQIKEGLEEISNPKKSGWGNLSTLFLTLVFFGSFGLFHSSITDLAILVVVLVIHELGHLLGMKIFGYKNLRIFFIPFLGAAASGREQTGSSVKKAVISLLGPVPGIIIGIFLVYYYYKTKNQQIADIAKTFLFINGFNLLPFHPLDGGRFFDYLLFSRHPYVETVFKILTLALMVLLGFDLSSPALIIFSLFMLLTLTQTYTIATIAHEMKKEGVTENSTIDQISEPLLLNIIERIKNKKRRKDGTEPVMNDKTRVKMFTNYIDNIWQRVSTVPASIPATMGLVILYLPFLFVGNILPFLVK